VSAAPVARLRVVEARGRIDVPAVDQAIADLLGALGRDPDSPHLLGGRLLEGHLSPRGAGVVLEAEHLCMTLRGVRSVGSSTRTSALRGTPREDHRAREEFFRLALGGN
jgi:GTP cyclohydrolase I